VDLAKVDDEQLGALIREAFRLIDAKGKTKERSGPRVLPKQPARPSANEAHGLSATSSQGISRRAKTGTSYACPAATRQDGRGQLGRDGNA